MLRNYTARNKVSKTQHFIVSKIRLLTRSCYTLQSVIRSYSGENNSKCIKEDNIKMKATSFIVILPPFHKDFGDPNLHVSMK